MINCTQKGSTSLFSAYECTLKLANGSYRRQERVPGKTFLNVLVSGSMIISLLMNINLGHLGGASIFAKIHLWRHFIEMFFFQLLWRGILISLNLYLFLVIHNNFTMSCYPNSALSSVMIPLSPNSFGCLWIEKLLLVLCLNTPSYYGVVS